MKIAIPIDEKNTDAKVSVNFGRAPYFLIVDTETKEEILLDNSAATSRGGAGIKAAQIIVDHETDVLLTPRLGKNAAEVIEAAEIEIYQTVAGSAKENIEAFTAGHLSLLEQIHEGFHRGGER